MVSDSCYMSMKLENAYNVFLNDIQLVAGGGYNTDHIYPVYFSIEEQTQ